MATTATKQPQKKNPSLSVGTKAIIKTGNIPCIIVKARAKMEWTVQIVDENGSPTQDIVDCTSQMLRHIRRHKGEIFPGEPQPPKNVEGGGTDALQGGEVGAGVRILTVYGG